MMRPPRLPFVLAFLGVLAVGGIWGIYRVVDVVRTEISAVQAQAQRKAKPRPPRVHVIREEDAASAAKPLVKAVASLDFAHNPEAYETFTIIIQSRFRRGDFEALDAYGEQLQRSRARFPDGGWMSYRYLGAFAAPGSGEDSPDPVWTAHLDRFRAWTERRPGSAQAAAAWGEALTSYAWQARGTGFAHEVTENGWAAFRERLSLARKVLEAASEARRGAIWYRAMQTVALGQGWNREEYEALFQRAVDCEPRFQSFYQAKATYLLPRWHGEEGEWQAFAVQAADQLGGREGDELFTQIQEEMAYYDRIEDWRKAHAQDWPRMLRGFEALRKEFGPSIRLDNQQLHMAGHAGDLAEARRMVDAIQDHWDGGVFSDLEEFKGYQDWALCRGKYARKH